MEQVRVPKHVMLLSIDAHVNHIKASLNAICTTGFVKGSIGVRLLAHRRGAVIEGIDKVIQTMTLGEKARILIR